MTGQLIADAFQTGVTLIKGAVLAIGFLAFLAAVFFLGVMFMLARVVARYRRADQVRREPPAALDFSPGVNLAAQDDCELIWAMPAREPGPERLLWAIRNEQQKGD